MRKVLLMLIILLSNIMYGQDYFIIDLNNVFVQNGQVDLLNVQIINTGSKEEKVHLTGKVKISNSHELISFSKDITLPLGAFNLSTIRNSISTVFSSLSLKDLYENHKLLPLGRINYCIEIFKLSRLGENYQYNLLANECININNDNPFIIELIDPEDNSKINTFNPNFTWVVNSPLIGQLQYRLILAPILKGQSKADALKRNALLFDQKNISTTSILYPIFAKTLEVNKKYAWNVEAYYKGHLLGSAKPWCFEILADTIIDSTQTYISYLDVLAQNDYGEVIVPGTLKLKYQLKNHRNDTLSLKLEDNKGKEVKLKSYNIQNIKYGDNRFEINFYQNLPLKHNKKYTLYLSGKYFTDKKIVFIYKNPDLM